MEDTSIEDFEQLLEENKLKIYRICKIYAHAPIEPQDLFQEVVIQIWNSRSTFKGNSNIKTWVYRIALNVCHRSKIQLQKKNHKTDRLDSIKFVPRSIPPDAIWEEKIKALHNCIRTLKESDRTIVILYLEELSYREIANIIGFTENHVAVKMMRIRKSLLNCITTKIN